MGSEMCIRDRLMQSVKWIEGVRLLGVSVAHLEPADAVPVLNFAEDERLGKRNQAVDILKAKFGEDIIKRGFYMTQKEERSRQVVVYVKEKIKKIFCRYRIDK